MADTIQVIMTNNSMDFQYVYFYKLEKKTGRYIVNFVVGCPYGGKATYNFNKDEMKDMYWTHTKQYFKEGSDITDLILNGHHGTTQTVDGNINVYFQD